MPRAAILLSMNAVALHEAAEQARLYRTTQLLPMVGSCAGPTEPTGWWLSRAVEARADRAGGTPRAARLR